MAKFKSFRKQVQAFEKQRTSNHILKPKQKINQLHQKHSQQIAGK